MDKCREQFEAFAKDDMWLERMRDGSCKSSATKKLWDCWQASRQALVVELPRARSDVDYGYEPSEIIDLLELAGIKCT